MELLNSCSLFIVCESVKKRIQHEVELHQTATIKIKNRKKNSTEIDLHIKLPYGDKPGG